MQCASCQNPLQPDWKACPFCGTATQRSCISCANPLDPAWVACPFCGTQLTQGKAAASQPARSATTTQPTSLDEEAIWQLWERLGEAFFVSLLPTFTVAVGEPDAVGGMAAFLGRLESFVFEHQLEEGLAALEEELGSPDLPAQVRQTAQSVQKMERELVRSCRASFEALRRAARPLEDVHGVGESPACRDNSQRLTKSAERGAKLGGFVSPVVGELVGFSMGLALAHLQSEVENNEALTRWAVALQAVHKALVDAFCTVWDRIGEQAGLPPARDFVATEEAWVLLAEELGTEAGIAELDRVDAFIEQHGPLGEALKWVSTAAIGIDNSRAEARSKRLVRLYPNKAEHWEVRALVCIDRNRADLALSAVSSGLELEADHRDLLLSRLEALVMCRQVSAAKDLLKELTDPDGTLRLVAVRGAVRAGDHVAGADLARPFVKDVGLAAAWDTFQANAVLDEVTEEVFRFYYAAPPTPDPAHVAAVAECIRKRECSWFGLPEDRKAVVLAWLPLEEGEHLLYHYDWTLWAAGLGGIVITNRKLFWHPIFGDTLAFELSELTPDHIYSSGALLSVGGHQLDLEVAGLGDELAAALRRLLELVT